jgi:ceramide glucosyltransferase
MVMKLLIILIVAGWAFWLIAWMLTRSFFRESPHQSGSYQPPVTILKPVRGVDDHAYHNFETFCQQDYPEYEILFGVDDANDPVVPIITRLQRDYPERSIRLIQTSIIGTNRKASILHQLVGLAKYDILAVSDSDMYVDSSYLSEVVAPLADGNTGLVTCPYRAAELETFTARLEAMHMSVTFMPSVMIGRKLLGMRFGLGASLIIRRAALDAIGGFLTVANYLADDYEIGYRIRKAGFKVVLSRYIMINRLGATRFMEQWHREIRWARCVRVSRPLEYPFIVLTFSTPLSIVTLFLSNFSPLAVQLTAVSLLLRWVVAWFIAGHIQDDELRRWLPWLPVRDMLSALVWLAAMFGRTVYWRGERFRMDSDGHLLALKKAVS